MSRSRLAVIVNPASRRGQSVVVHERVAELARLSGIEVVQTQRRGQATEIARSLALAGYERVIAVGGDGTLSEVANGLALSETALAAIPAGTGNDWVRTIAVPNDTNVAWHIATHGRIATTDLAEVADYGYCLNVLGAGFDAAVAKKISEAKGLLAKLGPKPRYLASVFGTFLGYHRSAVRVSIDGRETSEVPSLLLAAVGVAKFYGSGMQILPKAVIDDGLLDIVWGARVSAIELPGLLSKLYKGAHLDHPKVTVDRCRSVTIESDAVVPFHIDGDVRGVLPISVHVRPKALRVVVP